MNGLPTPGQTPGMSTTPLPRRDLRPPGAGQRTKSEALKRATATRRKRERMSIRVLTGCKPFSDPVMVQPYRDRPEIPIRLLDAATAAETRIVSRKGHARRAKAGLSAKARQHQAEAAARAERMAEYEAELHAKRGMAD